MSERLKRCLNLSAADFRIVRVIYKDRFGFDDRNS